MYPEGAFLIEFGRHMVYVQARKDVRLGSLPLLATVITTNTAVFTCPAGHILRRVL